LRGGDGDGGEGGSEGGGIDRQNALCRRLCIRSLEFTPSSTSDAEQICICYPRGISAV